MATTFLQRLAALTERFEHNKAEALLRTAVFAWCLVSTVVMLPVADRIWGPNAYITPARLTALGAMEGHRILFELDLLNTPTFARHYALFLGAYLFFVTLGLLGKGLRVVPLVVLALFHVLMLKANAVEDGGDRLMTQLLFYLALSSLFRGVGSPLGNVVRNLSFFSIRVQLCVVYATAALSKLTGRLWPGGEALYYVFHTDEYTWPWIRDLMGNSGALMALSTYAVLLFQLSFPFLIWRNPTRRILMFVGTFLHLQIAIFLGIVSFGFAMIVGYLAFYTEDEAERLAARGARWSEAALHAARRFLARDGRAQERTP